MISRIPTCARIQTRQQIYTHTRAQTYVAQTCLCNHKQIAHKLAVIIGAEGVSRVVGVEEIVGGYIDIVGV